MIDPDDLDAGLRLYCCGAAAGLERDGCKEAMCPLPIRDVMTPLRDKVARLFEDIMVPVMAKEHGMTRRDTAMWVLGK